MEREGRAMVILKDKKLNLNFVKTVERLTKGAITMNIMVTLDAVAREEGKVEGKTEVITNLLATGKFTISEIANFTSVSEVFVKKVRAIQLKKKNNPDCLILPFSFRPNIHFIYQARGNL